MAEVKTLNISNVEFYYQKSVPVIQSLSLSISQGEFVGIVGPNGSGKSTVAKLLTGLLLPTTGNVVIDHPSYLGTDIRCDYKMVDIIHADPENQFITPTVFDEIAFSLQAKGKEDSEIRRLVNSELEKFNLVTYRDTHPFSLSVGEQFRLLLAVSLIQLPEFLILDEIFSMVDSCTKRELMDILLKIRNDESMGLIILTHRLEDLFLADRIIVLVEGKIAGEGTVIEMLETIPAHPEWGIEVPLLNQLHNELDIHQRNKYRHLFG